MERKRILIVAATTGYQTRVFAERAEGMGLHVQLATDRCHVLDNPWGDGAIPLRFERPEKAAESIEGPYDGVVALGDRPAHIASLAARRLGLPFSPPEAVAACKNKFAARERFRKAGLLVPEYYLLTLDAPPVEGARSASYPCVLKPLGLSASRGVIRAGDEAEFLSAFDRISALLRTPELAQLGDWQLQTLQVESFIEGREFALEGIVTDGRLHVFAIFDKPDPLNGPFFEETIYVTPSREPIRIQREIVETTRRAIGALGLTHGPVHAEMRVNDRGVWMLEVAARPIGGLCSKSLRFAGGLSLEELIICHALGEPSFPERESRASGVMMIPIPRNGIYQDVSGVEDAAMVENIEGVEITAMRGQRLLRLPEGNSYLGFIFARANTPDEVEEALRHSHAKLRFDIAGELAVVV